MARRMAMTPTNKCRMPLAANPARATTSKVWELVTFSAASAACLNSLLMAVPFKQAPVRGVSAPAQGQ
jgi:hypothetical protein